MIYTHMSFKVFCFSRCLQNVFIFLCKCFERCMGCWLRVGDGIRVSLVCCEHGCCTLCARASQLHSFSIYQSVNQKGWHLTHSQGSCKAGLDSLYKSAEICGRMVWAPVVLRFLLAVPWQGGASEPKTAAEPKWSFKVSPSGSPRGSARPGQLLQLASLLVSIPLFPLTNIKGRQQNSTTARLGR